jgi:hypothetical protein
MVLLEESIAACDVSKVTAAWGEGEDDLWEGGFCLTLEDNSNLMILRLENGKNQVFSNGEWEEPFTPPTEDYDENPDSIHQWLKDGCPPEFWEY